MGREVRVVLSLRAAEDLRQARERYREMDPNLADGFAGAFDQTIERLVTFPRSGTPVADVTGLRRARLRRFPYGVFYRLTASDVLRVLRVLHHRRDS